MEQVSVDSGNDISPVRYSVGLHLPILVLA